MKDVSTIADSLNSLSLKSNFLDEDTDSPEDEDERTSGLQLREYQKELAETALTGRNCIIYVPLGAGKARVSIKIVLEHLQRVPNAKIVLFAKTMPVVMQHYQAIKEHLPSEFKVMYLTNKNEDSMRLHEVLPQYSVVVLTPAVLLSHLCGNKPLLPGGICAFTLILFDECHHARKDGSYSDVMFYYMKEKRMRRNLPQVVGLTTNFGFETVKDLMTAKIRIRTICAKLDIDSIAVVKRNVEELKTILSKPSELQEELVETTTTEAKMKILAIMKKLEEKADCLAKDLNDADVLQCLRNVPQSKKGPGYCQWVTKLHKAISEAKPENDDSGTLTLRHIGVITVYLKSYHFTLESVDLAWIEDIIKFLDHSFLPFYESPGSTEEEKIFYQEFLDLKEVASRQRATANPNLERLGEKLREHVAQKDSDARVIVFVRTRMLAEAVVSWLDRCDEDDPVPLNATRLTGTGESEGTTKSEQEHVIEQFRSGKIKVLVATPVAEEGLDLDIPRCTLIIRYNAPSKNGSKGGRGCESGAVSFNFAMPDSQCERTKCERLQLSERTMSLISEMSSKELSRDVYSYQDRLSMELDHKERDEAKQRRFKQNVNFKMFCMGCEKLTIRSSDLRSINGMHRVSINRELLDYIKIEPFEETTMHGCPYTLHGTVYCKTEIEPGRTCGYRIGKIMKYGCCPLPAFGCDKFMFLCENQRYPSPIDKWKNVRYYVKELTHDDVMMYAYGNLHSQGRQTAAY